MGRVSNQISNPALFSPEPQQKRAAREGRPFSVHFKSNLPAILATAEVSLAWSTAATAATASRTATATSAATALTRHRTRLVDNERPAHEVLAVTILNGRLRLTLVVDLHEPEPASLSTEAVAHHIYAIYTVPGVRKEVLNVGFIR
jgi:hypothetical protein